VELSWLTKLRIAGVLGLGVAVIGFLAWPLVAPGDPYGAVLAANLSLAGLLIVGLLAVLTGFLAYFLAWPHGREIGILAVPAGLAIWAARSGSVGQMIQQDPALSYREQLFSAFRFEPLFWLAIVAVGLAGVLLGHFVAKPGPAQTDQKEESKAQKRQYANAAIAIIASVFIGQIGIRVFVRGVAIGSAVGQPANAQIIFGVFLAFGIAGFVAKKFLEASYIWPAAASALVTAFVNTFYVKADAVQRVGSNLAAVFFPNATCSILPIQMVSVGVLGSIAGYWCAVRFNYWRKHEM
jgi:hypothetical protein